MEKRLDYQEPGLIELESLFSGSYIVIGDSSCTVGETEDSSDIDVSDDPELGGADGSDW